MNYVGAKVALPQIANLNWVRGFIRVGFSFACRCIEVQVFLITMNSIDNETTSFYILIMDEKVLVLCEK